jgi:hypothetical protein
MNAQTTSQVRDISAKHENALERFRAKACPGLDPGWIPVRVKKTRQNNNLEPRSDFIGTKEAQGRNPAAHQAGETAAGNTSAPPKAVT